MDQLIYIASFDYFSLYIYNKLQELVMVECTLMENYASGDLFAAAVNSTDKLYQTFDVVVDVKRARMGGIRPIPLKEIHDDMSGEAYEEDEQIVHTDGFFCRGGVITELRYKKGFDSDDQLYATMTKPDGSKEEVVFHTDSEECLYLEAE